LLGPQWEEASPIFMYFAIAGLSYPVTITTGWLFVTQGRGGELFTLGLLSGVVAICAIGAGLPYGAEGVALTSALAILLIRSPLAFWMASRSGPVRLSDLLIPVASFLPPGLAVLGAILAMRWWLAPESAIVGLALSAAVGVPAFFAAALAIPACRGAMVRMVDIARVLRPRGRRG